jgi:hypothetical protein
MLALAPPQAVQECVSPEISRLAGSGFSRWIYWYPQDNFFIQAFPGISECNARKKSDVETTKYTKKFKSFPTPQN